MTVCILQIDALEYIHDKDYAHADIKAANLMTGYKDPNQVRQFVCLVSVIYPSFDIETQRFILLTSHY